MQKQVRILKTSQRRSGKDIVYGITLKKDIAIFASGVYYQAQLVAGDILLKSGTCLKPDMKEVRKYRFEDSKIEDRNIK